jgi:hypothetical protein
MDYDQYIAKLDTQLQATGCTLWRDLEFAPDRQVSLLATRMKYSLVRIPVHLCVSYTSAPTPDDFTKFFEDSLLYCKRAFSGTKGAKIWVSSFAIAPCLVCDVALPETIKYVTRFHFNVPMQWKYWYHGLVLYPVLYCLSTNEVYYWTGYNYAGSAVWPFARELIKDSIVATATILELDRHLPTVPEPPSDGKH